MKNKKSAAELLNEAFEANYKLAKAMDEKPGAKGFETWMDNTYMPAFNDYDSKIFALNEKLGSKISNEELKEFVAMADEVTCRKIYGVEPGQLYSDYLYFEVNRVDNMEKSVKPEKLKQPKVNNSRLQKMSRGI